MSRAERDSLSAERQPEGTRRLGAGTKHPVTIAVARQIDSFDQFLDAVAGEVQLTDKLSEIELRFPILAEIEIHRGEFGLRIRGF